MSLQWKLYCKIISIPHKSQANLERVADHCNSRRSVWKVRISLFWLYHTALMRWVLDSYEGRGLWKVGIWMRAVVIAGTMTWWISSTSLPSSAWPSRLILFGLVFFLASVANNLFDRTLLKLHLSPPLWPKRTQGSAFPSGLRSINTPSTIGVGEEFSRVSSNPSSIIGGRIYSSSSGMGQGVE